MSDVLYGLIQTSGISIPVTPGTAIRGMVLASAIYTCFRYRKIIGGRSIFMILLLTIISLYPIFVSFLLTSNVSALGRDISSLLKVLYGPIVTLYFVYLIRSKKLAVSVVFKYVELAAYFIGASLLLTKYSGIGLATYGDYAAGYKGLFLAQNDFSLSLTIALSVAVYNCFVKPNVVRVVFIALCFVALSGLGTRTGIFAVVLIPSVVFLIVMVSRSRNMASVNKWIYLILISPIILFAGYKFMQQGLSAALDYNYHAERIATIMQGDHPRQRLIDTGLEYIKQRDIHTNIFGEGQSSYSKGVYQYWLGVNEQQARIVEVDFIDLYGMYGIFFVVLLHLLLFKCMLRIFKAFQKTREIEYGIMFLVIVLYTGHSMLAGHALTSSIVSGLIAPIMALCVMRIDIDRFKKRERVQTRMSPVGVS